MFALEIETTTILNQSKTIFMKTFIRKSVIAATLLLAVAASSFQGNAQDEKLIYNQNHNSTIGITVENAVGANYVIKDKKGNIIYKGTVKSDKTFYIPTAKLGKGEYKFQIGSLVLQEFIIK
jgi:PKD repeat protein